MVTMEGGAFTVRLTCWELLPTALVAVTVSVKMPGAAGMPLIMPVEEPRVNPEGSAPLVTVQVIGVVPVTVSVCEYGAPVSAVGKGDVIDGGVDEAPAAALVTLEEGVAASRDLLLITEAEAVALMAASIAVESGYRASPPSVAIYSLGRLYVAIPPSLFALMRETISCSCSGPR